MGAVAIDVRELDRLIKRVNVDKVKWRQSRERDPLLAAIGDQQLNSARRRIADTKRAPDGSPWPSWSEGYARTREARHSLLRSDGGLLDSLTYEVDGNVLTVGSNLVYAASHLYGDPDRGIPQREYLDTTASFIDPDDRAEVEDIVQDWLGGLL